MMMKQLKNIGVCMLALLSMASCQMLEGEKESTIPEGRLLLNITTPDKGTTRAADDEVNTDDFTVTLTGPNDFSQSYKVSEMPPTLTLPVGTYTVQAHTQGELQKKMLNAYFAGNESFTITEGITNQQEVVCQPQNSRIQIQLGQEFAQAYQSWELTLDDGSNGVLQFSHESQDTYYWQIAPNVKTLTLNFLAMPKGENQTPVRGRMTITKANAGETYEGDNEHYQGGDAIKIILKQNADDVPADEETALLGLNISSTLTFANTDETVEIPVVWEQEEGPAPTPDGNEKPQVAFTHESVSVTIGAANNPDLQAVISAPKGLKSVLVKAVSDGGFQGAMEDLQEGGLNLLTGHELIGDQMLPAVFEGLGVTVAMPKANDTEYTFVITHFYEFLAIYGSGNTTFSIKVTDQQGQTVEASVAVNIIVNE